MITLVQQQLPLQAPTPGFAPRTAAHHHGGQEPPAAGPQWRRALTPRRQNPEAEKLSAHLAQLAAGTHSALAGCFDLMGPVVFSLAVRMLRDRGAAEDVTQDVFVQVWRQAQNFDPARGSPQAWVMMIARTRILDRLRSRRAGIALRHAGDQLPEAPDAEDWPDDLAISREHAACVRKALLELPTEQRQAVELAFFEGLTHQEIAQRTDVALGTIKTRIRLGLLKIRDRLRSVMEETPGDPDQQKQERL